MLYHYLSSNASGQPEPAVGGKTLVAYFSATNTTRPLAEYSATGKPASGKPVRTAGEGMEVGITGADTAGVYGR